MGREVKRVAMDFEAPLWKEWSGNECPHVAEPCTACDGRGDLDKIRGLEHLVRLILIAGSDVTRTSGIRPHPYFNSTPIDRIYPGLEEISTGLAGRTPSFMGHDACDAWAATKKIIAAAGLDPETWGRCSVCGGTGEAPGQEELIALREAWERPEPPAGDGWQLWQTVSDGPCSPVFATPEELARWLVAPGNDTSVTQGRTYDQWLAFIVGPGWAPSMVFTPQTGLVTGVEFSEQNGEVD